MKVLDLAAGSHRYAQAAWLYPVGFGAFALAAWALHAAAGDGGFEFRRLLPGGGRIQLPEGRLAAAAGVSLAVLGGAAWLLARFAPALRTVTGAVLLLGAVGGVLLGWFLANFERTGSRIVGATAWALLLAAGRLGAGEEEGSPGPARPRGPMP